MENLVKYSSPTGVTYYYLFMELVKNLNSENGFRPPAGVTYYELCR